MTDLEPCARPVSRRDVDVLIGLASRLAGELLGGASDTEVARAVRREFVGAGLLRDDAGTDQVSAALGDLVGRLREAVGEPGTGGHRTGSPAGPPAPVDVPTVRPCTPEDRPAVEALAGRLTAGVAPWRDPQRVRDAVTGWVAESLDTAGSPDRAVFVADNGGRVTGFVTVSSRTHWTGEVDGCIGELVVAPDVQRTGVASALVRAAEEWARGRGLDRVAVDTGAANAPARSLYAGLGYREEDVRFSRSLG